MAPDARSGDVLPLPVAALALEARNRMQREPTRAHLCAYFAWEASVRLAVAAEPPADVGPLARPSVGDLVHALPATTRASTTAALLEVAALFAGSGAPRSTTRSKLLEFLPKYRNEHFHGGISRVDSDAHAARVLLAGLEAAWQEGLFWAPSNPLVYVDAVEIDSFGRRRAQVFVLQGFASQAEVPDEGVHSVEAEVLPGRIYLRAEGRYRSLHPWLVYDDGRVLFFNGMGRGGKYLDYARNEHVPSKSLLPKLPQLDADLAALFGGRAEARRGDVPVGSGQAEPSPEGPDTMRSRPHATGRPTWRRVALGVGVVAVIAGGVGLAMRSRVSVPVAHDDHAPSASATAPASPGASPDLDIPTVSTHPAHQAEFRRAVESFLAADIEASEDGFRQATVDEPEQPWPHLGLALAYAIEKRFDESFAEQTAMLDLAHGGKGDARDQKLVALIHATDDATFDAKLAEYRAENPRYLLALQALAYFGMMVGSGQERIGRADAVLAIDDSHPVSYLIKCWTLLRLGQRDAARAALEEGITRRATAPWLRDQHGLLRMMQGDLEGAKKDFLVAMSNHGPVTASTHYAIALLRSGTETDTGLLQKQIESMLADTNPDQRANALCPLVTAMDARGRVRDADALLHRVLDDRPGGGAPKAGTVARCLVLPLWVDDALGRSGDKEGRWRLDSLRALFHRPQLSQDDIANFQRLDATVHGIAAAEAGHLTEARQELESLQQEGAHETFQVQLTAELSAHIQLASGQPVTVREADASAGPFLRARVAHLKGRVAERDHDDAGAMTAYAALTDLATQCTNSDEPYLFACAPFVADGLARLARLQARHPLEGELSRTLATFDAVWPRPDPELAAVRTISALRHARP